MIALGPTGMPLIPSSVRIAISDNLSTNIKRKGDRLCLVPLLGLNYIEVNPLLLTHVSESWYTVCTHFVYISPNPYSFSASAMEAYRIKSLLEIEC